MQREDSPMPMLLPTTDTWLLMDYRAMCDTFGPLDLAGFVEGYRAMDRRLTSTPIVIRELRRAS